MSQLLKNTVQLPERGEGREKTDSLCQKQCGCICSVYNISPLVFICRSTNQGSALPMQASITALVSITPKSRRTQHQKLEGLPKPIDPSPLSITAALCWCHLFLHPHLPQPHTAVVMGSFNPFLNHRVNPALQYRHCVTRRNQGKEHTHICIDVCAKHRCPVRWLIFTVGWTINPRKQFIQIYSLYQGSTGKQAAFFGDFKCLHLVCRWQQ